MALAWTGVDYFGSIIVKQWRSTIKRWIALFTCLSIRIVHLEVVYSSSTQSCVTTIRGFVVRRDTHATFCSDNGTNSTTKWLNPLLASRMRGMVRSVKVVMAAIADHSRHPNDEVLETVLLEAESVVNSRSFTYVPLDHATQKALSPNQPSRDFEKVHSTLRDSWRLAIYLVDTFWTRWLREYLPTLTRCTK